MIHITDGKSDKIIGYITPENILDNEHRQSLQDTLETFDFTTFADKPFSEHLAKRNRVIIPAEDTGYIEFVIHEVIKYRDSEGLKSEVYSSASYIELKKAKVIEPIRLEEYTPSTVVGWTLNGTEWTPGIIEGDGYRTFEIENHTNPYVFLKTVANEFGLELRFRVETDGNKITGRYVDLLEQVGEWRGREIEFGRDLIGIKRTENTENIYTALIGLGPEKEDGTRLQVLVEDEDALQRWGRPDPRTGELKHLIGVYEPQSDRQDMTLAELQQYTRTELDKRINEVVTYETDIADLENVPGMENKQIRFGDTIKIKDTKFNPPLYLEARVFEQSRSITDKSQKRVKLGDYTEYTEEEVQAIWKQLQAEIRTKISLSEALEVIYTKEEVDERDTPGNEAKEKLDRDVGDAIIESVDGAQQKAEQAEQNAKDHADSIKQQIDDELAKKASQQAVEAVQQTVDNLQDTANNLQQAVSDHADELAAHDGRITTVETDLDIEKGRISAVISDLSTVEDTISQQQTQISANTNAISLKADQSELDTVKGDVSSLSGELNVLAGKVELKAERSELEALEGDVYQVSNDLAQLTVDVDGISSEVSSVRADLDGLEIGGRNLFRPNITAKNRESSEVTRISPTSFYVNTSWSKLSERFDVEENEQITVSFWAKNKSDIEEDRFFVQTITYDENDSRTNNNGFQEYTSKEWRFYSYTFTVAETSTSSDFNMRTDNGDVWINGLMIVRGNKAPADWTPAPEDVQAEISAVEQYASSIDQKADSISATVSSLQTTVGEHGTQISQAQTDIQVIAGQVSTKAEASEVTELGTKVTTVEQNLSALEGVVETKVDDGEARSIFLQEASSFTFSAEQINFDGHVFGENATFNGRVEGALIEGSTFKSYGELGGNPTELTISGGRIVGLNPASDLEFVVDPMGFYIFDDRYNASYAFGAEVQGVLMNKGSEVTYLGTDGLSTSGKVYSSRVGASGGLQVSNETYTHSITAGVANGNMFIYPERVSGNDIFTIRSHDGFANYRTDLVINSSGQLKVGEDSLIDRQGRFISSSFVTLRSETDFAYVQSPNRLRVTKPGTATDYVPVEASAFNTGSLATMKKDIHPIPFSTLEIINNSELYRYHLISEGEDAPWRHGLVIGEGYKTPKEVMDGEATISQYDMNTFAWKAIQELSGLIKDIQYELDSLKYRTSLLEKKTA